MAAVPVAARPEGSTRRRAAAVAMSIVAVAATSGGSVWATGIYPGKHQHVAAASPWRTGWALSLDHPGKLAGTALTCRLVARIGLSGTRVRFRLVNYPSISSVTFTHLVAAVRASGLDVDSSTQREVTVQGSAGVMLAPNGEVLTDPVDLPLRRGQDVTLSVAVGSGVSAPWHYWSSQSSGCTPANAGDTAAAATGASFCEHSEDRWLSEVQVLPASPIPSFAVYGDSLTDGLFLPVDTAARWTDRLQGQTGGRVVALNFGVAGDRITGQAPQGRLPPRVATDVLSPAGLSAVVVEMGSNDIKAGVGAPEILAEYRVIAAVVAQAHETLIAATVPARGDDLPAEAEHQRQLLNEGLRAYPIVADIDAVLTDPATGRLRASYDVGDHVHPNSAGVDAITSTMRAALAKIPGALGAAVR